MSYAGAIPLHMTKERTMSYGLYGKVWEDKYVMSVSDESSYRDG